MGITTEIFFENIYKIMFSPKSFFEDENKNISVRLAIGIIAVMTAINKLSLSIIDKSINGWGFIFSLIFSVIFSILMWFIISLFFEYMAKIFDRGGKLSELLYLSAFSTIPALFFAPLNMIKSLGEFGYILSVVLGCLLYLWIIFLYAYSIKTAYRITLARAFMLIFLPMISSILAFYQLVGFFHKIWYIFSI